MRNAGKMVDLVHKKKKKSRRKEGKKGMQAVVGRDKCELEVSKTPCCEDSKVSYPTKQQVHTNYAMWPRGSCSLWVLWRKEASVALHKQGSKSTKPRGGKRLPSLLAFTTKTSKPAETHISRSKVEQ